MTPNRRQLRKQKAVPMAECIRETVDCSGVTPTIDREKGIVHGVKVLGLKSKNDGGKRRYTQECVDKAAPLYEGLVAFVDHDRQKGGGPRPYRDKLGVHRNIRKAPDSSPGLVSDFHLNMKHPLAEMVLWDAEHDPSSLGFSHDAQGKVTRKNNEVVVEEIFSVASCDLVCNPATTNGLFEEDVPIPEGQEEFCAHGFSAMSDMRTILVGAEDQANKSTRILSVLEAWASELGAKIQRNKESTMEWSDVTPDNLREHRKELYESLTAANTVAQLQAELAAAKDAADKATAKLAEAEAKQAVAAKQAAILEELKAAKIDTSNKAVCSDALMAQLMESKDAEARKPLIAVMALAQRPASGGYTPPFGAAVGDVADGPGDTAENTLARL